MINPTSLGAICGRFCHGWGVDDGVSLHYEEIEITTLVNMDGLAPQDIRVEVYFGQLNEQETIDSGQALTMQLEGKESSGSFKYKAQIACDRTGQHGFSVRVLPSHPDLENSHEMGMITWYNAY